MVELASLIARERFSDRPRCVCPVIGAFLRGWNDRATHAQRQRLIPYATLIVGSRAGRAVTRLRRDLCLEWAGADLRGGAARRALSRLGMRLRIAVYCSLDAALRLDEGAGDYASRVAAARGDADGALELLDALLAAGERRPPASANGRSRRRVDRGDLRPLPFGEPDPSPNGDASRAGGQRTGVPLAPGSAR